ncbi:MAG: hypothetical protein JW726_17565 [Anaerolineales bacterium]|nr:hypothetical protein [Anaerolineales bacterium]
MFDEYEQKSARTERDPVFSLGVILVAVILVMMCCVLSFTLYYQLKEPSPTPLPDISVKIIPTLAIPANYFSIYFPVTLSGAGPVPVPVQNWKVTNISVLGYKLGGQRYDLVTFTHLDGQATAQGYCINPGWAIPELGVEYLLNAEGIFVPLHQSNTHPIQRFLKIR